MYVPGASQNPALPSPSLMDWHTLAAARVTGKPWGQGVASVMLLKLCVCGEQVAPVIAPEPAHKITCTLAAGTPLGVRIGGMSYLTPWAQDVPDRTMQTNPIFLITVSLIRRRINGRRLAAPEQSCNLVMDEYATAVPYADAAVPISPTTSVKGLCGFLRCQ